MTPADHDVPMDLVCTPERTVGPRRRTPDGVDRTVLPEERVEEIPVLRQSKP